MTQETVAAKSKLSVAYVSLLERGGRTAPLNTVERVAKAIGVEPHTLLVPPSPEAIQAAAA
jgi:transcriptional regulator with XRE-family HTH domain